MPTEPFEPILSRNLSKVLVQPVIDLASPALQEAVNYATNLYQRCHTSPKGTLDEAYPVLASYLHIIQVIDSIEVLVSSGCGAPTFLLLRSGFEAKLTMCYILEKKSETRANAWIMKNIVDEIEALENIDRQKDGVPRTAAEAEVFRLVGRPPVPLNLPKAVTKLKGYLQKPPYADAYNEYKRLNKQGVKRPEWYSLFEGPRSLRALAYHLDEGGTYHSLYSSWSKMSHVKDGAHLALTLDDGSSVLGPIRNPTHLVRAATYALSILLETSQLALKEYRTGELSSFHDWYGREIQRRHEVLVQMQLGELNRLGTALVGKKPSLRAEVK